MEAFAAATRISLRQALLASPGTGNSHDLAMPADDQAPRLAVAVRSLTAVCR